MNNIKKWLSPVVFCAFLLTLFVILVATPYTDYSETEKRYLEEAPVFRWEDVLNGSYQNNLENWIADQFPFRNFWVGLNAYTQLLLGKNAHQDVYFTADGYLVNAPASLNLSDFEKSLSRFDKFAATTNLPSTLLMVPSTGYLHEDELPAGHEPYPDDAMFSIASSLLQNIDMLDPREILTAGDNVTSVAYRTDHHLTSHGNYILYSAYRDHTEGSILVPDQYSKETVHGFYGTTWSGSGYWLTPADDLEIWDSGVSVTVTIYDGGEDVIVSDTMFFSEHLSSLDKYPVFLDGNHALTSIHNPASTNGNLLIIKDSYAHGFAPFLAEHYQNIYLLDLRYYRGKVSDFITEHHVDELLFLYGTSTLLTDTNSAWLF